MFQSCFACTSEVTLADFSAQCQSFLPCFQYFYSNQMTIQCIALLLGLVLLNGCSATPIKELNGCKKDTALARIVWDNVSPWTSYYYNCRNTEPDFYWSAECLEGSCINPNTNKPLDNYTITPIYRTKYFKIRGSSTMIMSKEVIIACKCVPNENLTPEYEYEDYEEY